MVVQNLIYLKRRTGHGTISHDAVRQIINCIRKLQPPSVMVWEVENISRPEIEAKNKPE